jgi:hypothetical protein
MNNETYLIASYFTVGGLCLGIALLVYFRLRRPIEGIANSLPNENWRKTVRKAFPLSTVLFVLSSCLSVNYYGCEQKEYREIVSDRSYIASKNAQQVSEALKGVIWSVALWSTILAIALRGTRRHGPTQS